MRNKQLQHHQVNFNKNSAIEISLLLNQIDSPANLGSIFRNAEAFGIKAIWIHEANKKDLESNRFKRTSRSTEKNLDLIFYDSYQSVFKVCNSLKVGLEITNNSRSIKKLGDIETNQILLVLGNEKSGIAEDILEELDEVYHINMFGKNSSLNVAQTLGIALHEIRR
jgi:tRNA G18 (ribose-2'-O)-methylase SpoU